MRYQLTTALTYRRRSGYSGNGTIGDSGTGNALASPVATYSAMAAPMQVCKPTPRP